MDLSTPRGMRDFLPGEMAARERVFSTVRRVYSLYGFPPMETPALESVPVLTAKCGDDVAKQVFRVQDSDLGLRFDLTVPLARAVAGNSSLAKPFKRCCVARVWRREEPQKGRFREFWQADADIIGSASMRCEAELLAAACDALSALGFTGAKIRVNSRKLLSAAMEKLGLPPEKEFAVFRSLDKLEKIGAEGVGKELAGKGFSEAEIAGLLSFGEIRGSSAEKISGARELLAGAGRAEEGLEELEEILSLFSGYAASRACGIEVDFALVRGLDYYTGPIFEISAGKGGVGSLAGGGRYDDLIALYGAPPTPAVGISLGIERILELLKAQAGDSGAAPASRVFVAPVKPEFYPCALSALQEFRAAGVPAEIDLMERSLRKQLDYANSSGIPFAAIVGEREKKEGKVTLRNLESGEEKLVSASDAAKSIST
ncbi:MAG: histidine--tRNA ligase [Candidatus ainarchaeum sp.]|nr:histidine--tRNA ligase [Candidatus ainarchaeum sp.]